VKKICKSVKIWQNYGHESAAPFFGPPCICNSPRVLGVLWSVLSFLGDLAESCLVLSGRKSVVPKRARVPPICGDDKSRADRFSDRAKTFARTGNDLHRLALHRRTPVASPRPLAGARPINAHDTPRHINQVAGRSQYCRYRHLPKGWDIIIIVILYWNHRTCMKKTHTIFGACFLWPWLGYFCASTQYAMFFRFCGWRSRHIFNKRWRKKCL